MIEKIAADLKVGDVFAKRVSLGVTDSVRRGEVVTKVENWGDGWVHVWTDEHTWGIGPQLPTSRFQIRG